MIENNAVLFRVGGFGEARLWRVAPGGPAVGPVVVVLRQEPPQSIHRSCGQLCGQVGSDGRKAAIFLALPQFAQSLGTENSLKINHLLHCDDMVTGIVACQPSIGALVEFCSRAGIGIAA
ncbi:hypothetical protein [Ideonella sp. BN130291]|uniref:hypothetical protein n=1 Tax=Ideonella sp. BN130291 TaxID=3112940 RepID=UPI002E267CAC|nr:hypothetical protein [Ideonella sp. BN130291]